MFRLRVDVVELPVAIEGEESVGDAFEDGAGLIADLLAVGDVGDGADEAGGLACGVFALEVC